MSAPTDGWFCLKGAIKRGRLGSLLIPEEAAPQFRDNAAPL